MSDVEKKRLVWIDFAKFFAMLCVILGHTNGHFFSHGMPLFSEINGFIVFFNMPLFVILSGYVGYSGLKKIENAQMWFAYIKKMFVHLMLPCITMGLFYFLCSRNVSYLYFNTFWFLKMLFLLYFFASVIALFVSKKKNKYSFWIGCLTFLMLMIFLDQNSTAEMCVYFVVGFLLKKYDGIKRLNARNFFLMTIVSVFLVFFFFWDVRPYEFYQYPILKMLDNKLYLNLIMRFVYGVMLSLTILQIVFRIESKVKKCSKYGGMTLGLYLFHIFVLKVLNSLHVQFTNDCAYMWFVALALSFFVFVVSVFLVRIIEKNKYSKLFLLGMK